MLKTLSKYNNTVHSTKEVKPNEAKLPQNHLWVAWLLQNASQKNRPYEELKKEHMFRIMIKKQINHTCRTGQMKNIKLLELITITFC